MKEEPTNGGTQDRNNIARSNQWEPTKHYKL